MLPRPWTHRPPWPRARSTWPALTTGPGGPDPASRPAGTDPASAGCTTADSAGADRGPGPSRGSGYTRDCAAARGRIPAHPTGTRIIRFAGEPACVLAAGETDEHLRPRPAAAAAKLDPMAKAAWVALFGGPGYLLVVSIVPALAVSALGGVRRGRRVRRRVRDAGGQAGRPPAARRRRRRRGASEREPALASGVPGQVGRADQPGVRPELGQPDLGELPVGPPVRPCS